MLVLVGFYRKFIPFFADITIGHNKMLRKGTPFNWNEQCKNAFNLLKEELAKMPMLQYPHSNKLFLLFTDPSKHR